jgi:hypothetical protein
LIFRTQRRLLGASFSESLGAEPTVFPSVSALTFSRLAFLLLGGRPRDYLANHCRACGELGRESLQGLMVDYFVDQSLLIRGRTIWYREVCARSRNSGSINSLS